jgi:hypothetical protein
MTMELKLDGRAVINGERTGRAKATGRLLIAFHR